MSNEQPHDPTITLRLELGRVTDQRDAFKAALNTELLKVAKVAIYQAMLDADSKAADTIGCMGVEVDDLRKENTRLKAEVDLWKLRSDNWQKLVQVTKAEVERLAMAGNQSIAVGAKLREMVGDHHWSMEFDRVRTDWCHASRGALSRCQNPNTPPTAV